MSSEPLVVSVVMPCLNEAETLERCVASALLALRTAGLAGEVIVADNGSTDGSQALAERAGARVVAVPQRGYGAALLGGIEAARGRFIVMGDADDSYDFGAVPTFVAELSKGRDLVMGSRFLGRIEKGAMPFLHRWLGNPVLTAIGRLFFDVPASDFHCGIRGFRKDAIQRLGLRTTGMEFASEMVVKASLFGLSIGEIPVTLRKDGRSRPPHLRTWRDGWRHLRFLLLYSPRWLFNVPGALLVTLGAALMLWLLPGPRHVLGAILDVHAMLGAAAMVLVGVQSIQFGLFARIFAVTEGLLPMDPRLRRTFDFVTLEAGLVLGGLSAGGGLLLVLDVIRRWARSDYTSLSYADSMRVMIPGVLLLVLGAQTILSSFFLSILGLKRKSLEESRSVSLEALGALHGKMVFSRRVRVLAGEIARLLPAGRLADVGCGSGTIAAAVRRLRPDVLPEGYDVFVRESVDIPVTPFDGKTLPLPDDSREACLLVDVLHHAADPVRLLSECARVAPIVVVKDHLERSALDDRILAVMDWVGNRPHGVVLPYHYFTPATWKDACEKAGLVEVSRSTAPGLYPFPLSLVFGRGLHFVVRLERAPKTA